MEIGDRVVRITTEQKGYIHDLKPGRIVMVRVRWLGGMTAGEWLPSEEVRVWDKMPMPVQPPPRKRRKPVAPLEKVHWAGTSTCKKCGEGNLRWGDVKGKWRLFNGDEQHHCKRPMSASERLKTRRERDVTFS